LGHYRCYFIAGGSIKGSEDIEAPDDACALLKADELLLSSTLLAIEVWQEKRMVGRHVIAPELKFIKGGRRSN
jgi:hypothetical protein